jgi:hypothetical protein
MIQTPHVERPWRDEFVITLRLRGATGAAIGDALAHVESFCAESGESAEAAFGRTSEYARSLPTESGAVGRSPS